MMTIEYVRATIQEGCTLWARQTMDSEIFSKPAMWFKIWFYIVGKANHTNNGQFERGQCFLKYEWIINATGASTDQVKHCIEYLKARQMLATQKATRGMIVTVINYVRYQNLDNYRSHTKARQKPHKSHAINNNDKNGNIFSRNSDEFLLADLLFSRIKKRKPDFKKPDLQKWAVHIDRMIRLDKRKPETIEGVIDWCQSDSFWQNNILSTAKLREKFDQLELKAGLATTEQNNHYNPLVSEPSKAWLQEYREAANG